MTFWVFLKCVHVCVFCIYPKGSRPILGSWGGGCGDGNFYFLPFCIVCLQTNRKPCWFSNKTFSFQKSVEILINHRRTTKNLIGFQGLCRNTHHWTSWLQADALNQVGTSFWWLPEQEGGLLPLNFLPPPFLPSQVKWKLVWRMCVGEGSYHSGK